MGLFIHIGLRKTGSSALQESLARNREKLDQHSILYPIGLTEFPSHQELAWVLKPDRFPWGDGSFKGDKETVYRYYINLIDSALSRNKKVILSSEDLSLLVFSHSSIATLVQFFGIFNPKIVYYCRNPISVLISNYKHDVIQGQCTISFSDYVFNLDRFTIPDVIVKDIWESAGFNVLRLSYADIKNFDITSDFLSKVLNTDIDSEFPQIINSGLNYELLQECLHLNMSELNSDTLSTRKMDMREQYRKSLEAGNISRQSDDDFLELSLNQSELSILRRIYDVK